MVATLLAALVAGALLIAAARRGLGRAGARARDRAPSPLALLLVALAASRACPSHLARPARVGRARGRDRAGPRRRAERARALPRRRRVDADRHRPRRPACSSALAALLAFAPRRGGALGNPLAAAVALAVAVPRARRCSTTARTRSSAAPRFALLLAALPVARARRAARGADGGRASSRSPCSPALVLAPRLDGGRALLDYEALAQTLSAGPSDAL